MFEMSLDGVPSESILPRRTVGDGTVVVAFIDPIVMIVLTDFLIRNAVSPSNFGGHFVGEWSLFIPGRAVKYSIDHSHNN